VSEPQPVRGKRSDLHLDVYGRSCADGDVNWVGDYLHSNGYLPGPRLQLALNRARRQRESPPKAERGGLSRREWRRRQRCRAE
jgi:hypothetical protein